MSFRRYENGKYLHKRNTFTDFIACAEHLIENKWTSPARYASPPALPCSDPLRVSAFLRVQPLPWLCQGLVLLAISSRSMRCKGPSWLIHSPIWPLLHPLSACARRLCAEGRSAGGLTMGAVVTMRPDLVSAVLMGVPFVDIVTTMLDASIPLTTIEVG